MIPVHRDNRFSCGRRGFLFGSVRFSKSLPQGEGISGSIVFINGGAFVIEPADSHAKFLYFREAEEQSFFIAFDAERFL